MTHKIFFPYTPGIEGRGWWCFWNDDDSIIFLYVNQGNQGKPLVLPPILARQLTIEKKEWVR